MPFQTMFSAPRGLWVSAHCAPTYVLRGPSLTDFERTAA